MSSAYMYRCGIIKTVTVVTSRSDNAPPIGFQGRATQRLLSIIDDLGRMPGRAGSIQWSLGFAKAAYTMLPRGALHTPKFEKRRRGHTVCQYERKRRSARQRLTLRDRVILLCGTATRRRSVHWQKSDPPLSPGGGGFETSCNANRDFSARFITAFGLRPSNASTRSTPMRASMLKVD